MGVVRDVEIEKSFSGVTQFSNVRLGFYRKLNDETSLFAQLLLCKNLTGHCCYQMKNFLKDSGIDTSKALFVGRVYELIVALLN